MGIDFFKEGCKSVTITSKFGLCDDEASHAYLDIEHPKKWHGEVLNSNEKEIEFVAVDKCLEIESKEGETESTCDCLLRNKDQLIFVELKNRKKTGWVKKGREQITNTINLFKGSHSIEEYQVSAYVCNNKHPRSHTGHAANIQQFKNETGFILSTNKTIIIK